MSSPEVENTRDLRPAFWLLVGIATGGMAGLAIYLLDAGRAGAGLFSLLLFPFLIYLVIGAFAVGIRQRMLAAARLFPAGFPVPVQVGAAQAADSAELALRLRAPGVRLRANSYALLVVDVHGIHVLRGSGRAPGVVPVAIIDIGPITSISGGRTQLPAIVVRVAVDGISCVLTVVPTRLRGNPLRRLRPDEMQATRQLIALALAGTGSPTTLWPY